MSIELLDSLLTETDETRTHAEPSQKRPARQGDFKSFNAWRFQAMNEFFDANGIGKGRRKLYWKSQSADYL